jgi:tetratricopeptide (TPR) repeat protein
MQARVIVPMVLIWLCIITLGPTCKGDTWYQKGEKSFNNGSYDLAILCYDKAIKLNSTDIDAWNQKGRSLMVLGKYNESIFCFDKIIDMDPLNKYASCVFG